MRNRVDMEGNIMAAIIGSPTRYIQGKGEMKNLCSYADKFGKNLFILTSASGRKRVEPAINEGNKDSNLSLIHISSISKLVTILTGRKNFLF